MSSFVHAGVLRVSYEEDGPADGWPVILSHGFPFDVRAFDEVVTLLTEAGARTIRPYQRGFGPTRFLSNDTPRVGQQAALGSDLKALIKALDLQQPILAGYDWGGLASCGVAALWPERIAALVSMAGYDVIDTRAQKQPVSPSLENVLWYQHLFQTERGRECLSRHREEFCRLLWQQWSPYWRFEPATYARTAKSFDNPDFVDVVIHAYRHALGQVEGLPIYQTLEDRLAARPRIIVPAITLDGTNDPLKPGGTLHHADMFLGRHEHRRVQAGHNLPQEAPEAFAQAILTVRRWIA